MASEQVSPGVEQPEWLVTWSINVWADNATEAAVKAWLAVRVADSTANCFEVLGEGHRHIIDLSDQECRHCKREIHVDDDDGTWFAGGGQRICRAKHIDGGLAHEPHEPPEFPA